jgi:hypothetical protein
VPEPGAEDKGGAHAAAQPGTAGDRPREAAVSAWQIAWRLRRAVPPASAIPFLLMLGVDAAEPWVVDLAGGPDLGYLLVDTLHFPLDAMFIAMLLEAEFGRVAPPAGLPALLPSRSAVRFALLALPVGLAAVLLHLGIRTGMAEVLMRLMLDGSIAEPGPLLRFATEFLADPGLQIVLAGLILAPLAVRVLPLPALALPVRTGPDLRLAGMLATALAVALVLARGAGGVLAQLPVLGETFLPSYIAWYVGVFTLLTLAAAAIAALLHRRCGRSQPALA